MRRVHRSEEKADDSWYDVREQNVWKASCSCWVWNKLRGGEGYNFVAAHDETGLKVIVLVEAGDSGLWVGDLGTRVRELFDDAPGLEGDLLE
jgi:hypothetical protein